MTYLALRDYYEQCLTAHGACHKGVDWPDAASMTRRFEVMASTVDWDAAGAPGPLTILDVGCGPGFFLDFLQANFDPAQFDYYGIDISPKMISAARERHPDARFEARDLMVQPLAPAYVDYAVFNGVFTVRHSMTAGEAATFTSALLCAVFPSCRRGLAANFMAPHADWQDEKLFYLSFDEAAQLCKQRLSRHVSFISDYGLWEYTAVVRQTPRFS